MFTGIRFPLKTAGFLGWTVALYAALEAQTALSPASMQAELVKTWQHRYGQGLLRIFGVEVEPAGPGLAVGARYPGTDAAGRGRIFVMNHRTALDIFISLAFCEATIVSRADLAGWPVIGAAARRVGTLFVDRASRQSGATVVNAMVGALEQGRGVMIFPEGTTYQGDEVRPFHPGAFHAALRTGASIVPLGLAYAREEFAFGDEAFSTHMKRVAAEPTIGAALQAGEPVHGERGESVEHLRDRVHARVQQLVQAARARL
jgi:1-acyl-sn-glycerol-3-phosphate acyltransferase